METPFQNPTVAEVLTTDQPTSKYMKGMVRAYEQKYRLLLTVLKENSLNNLFMFNKNVLKVEEGDPNFVSLAPFHKELCDFVVDRKDRKKLILVPRLHLKSKLITIGYSVQQIIKNPKIRILIYSATWQMALDLNLNIQRKLVETKRIQEIWGNLTYGAKEWSQDRTRLSENNTREPTITAAGIDNNLVGGHYDIIIMDDVVNRDNVSTMDQINKVIQRYRDSLDLLEVHGQLIVIGTRWHDSDLYGWILDPTNSIRQSYEVLIKKAYEGNITDGMDFKALWEKKFSLKELKIKLREEGWSHFSSQYLNDPVPEEDAIFKRTWFRYYDASDMRGILLNKFMLVDPAISLKKEADFTSFVVIGVDQYGSIYILDILRAKLTPHDIIERMISIVSKYQLSDVGIEMVSYQKAISYTLREDERFKRRPFHITELKPNERTKDQRIKGLQPLYENGKIYHNRLDPNNIYLEDELIRFPRGTYDDVIDALSYSLDLIFPAKQKASPRRGRNKWLY